MRSAKHQDQSMKEHRRRFRIDGAQAQERLARALAVLESNEEAVKLALRQSSVDPVNTYRETTAALRLLAKGEP